jgi:hypothetical protein
MTRRHPCPARILHVGSMAGFVSLIPALAQAETETIETPFEVRATVGFLALALVIFAWIALRHSGSIDSAVFLHAC